MVTMLMSNQQHIGFGQFGIFGQFGEGIDMNHLTVKGKHQRTVADESDL
jgi:hypothetical protein